jgi:hypothetical protein
MNRTGLTPFRRLLLISACLVLIAGTTLPGPQKASAIAPLAFNWACYPQDGECYFTVTSTNHAKYSWGFGDGSFYGPTTSTTAYHDYNFSGSEALFTVTLVGYATVGSSSPDNIISCTVRAQGGAPGGHPGAYGSCSG